MKYLYCPKCKELRVKAWYQIKDRCQMCFSVATPIEIPNTWRTYVIYTLYLLTPSLVLVYVYNDDRIYLYAAVVLVVFLFVLSWLELSRGLDYAKARIKVTNADVKDFRKRGWS